MVYLSQAQGLLLIYDHRLSGPGRLSMSSCPTLLHDRPSWELNTGQSGGRIKKHPKRVKCFRDRPISKQGLKLYKLIQQSIRCEQAMERTLNDETVRATVILQLKLFPWIILKSILMMY